MPQNYLAEVGLGLSNLQAPLRRMEAGWASHREFGRLREDQQLCDWALWR